MHALSTVQNADAEDKQQQQHCCFIDIDLEESSSLSSSFCDVSSFSCAATQCFSPAEEPHNVSSLPLVQHIRQRAPLLLLSWQLLRLSTKLSGLLSGTSPHSAWLPSLPPATLLLGPELLLLPPPLLLLLVLQLLLLSLTPHRRLAVSLQRQYVADARRQRFSVGAASKAYPKGKPAGGKCQP